MRYLSVETESHFPFLKIDLVLVHVSHGETLQKLWLVSNLNFGLQYAGLIINLTQIATKANSTDFLSLLSPQ